MTETKQPKTPYVSGDNTPDSSFMSIHRKVRDAKIIEYRQRLIEIQDSIYDFKIKTMKKLRGAFGL